MHTEDARISKGIETMRCVIADYMARHPDEDPAEVDWEKARAAYRSRKAYKANKDHILMKRRQATNAIAAIVLEEMRAAGHPMPDADEGGPRG